MTTSARERVAAFWDAHIAAWLKGEDQLPPRLSDWFDSYVGVGPGEVTREGFPEPYHGDLLGLEQCYPWHSNSITAPLKPPPEVIEEFVWQPIAELPVQDVFAFGRPWNDLAKALKLPRTGKLGSGGTDYKSAAPSRAVRTYGLPSGQRLVVEWHAGSAGPPSAKESALLHDALVESASDGARTPTAPSPRAGASSDPALTPASPEQPST
jgi:hypothetical protein